jgi:hypothetical protein
MRDFPHERATPLDLCLALAAAVTVLLIVAGLLRWNKT